MTISATANIEINGTGADTNGGAFDPYNKGTYGNDMTYGTYAAVVSGSASSSNTTTVSATWATPAMQGNTFVAPGYGIGTIVGVNSGVSFTLNAAIGTFSALTCTVGGPWLTLDHWASLFSANGQGSQTTYLKNGTYTPTSALVFENGNSGINLIGYYQARGDITPTANKAYRPLIQGTSAIPAGGTLLTPANGNQGTVVFNVILDGASLGIQLLENASIMYNCQMRNTTGIQYQYGTKAIESEFINLTGLLYSPTNVLDSLFLACGGVDISGGSEFIRNLILNSNSAGISANNNILFIDSCTIFGSASGAGSMVGFVDSLRNSIFYSNNGAFNAVQPSNVPTPTILISNCAADQAIAGGTQSSMFTLTANPFVNSGATVTDLASARAAFALNNTAGGGALCRGAGTPQYLDIGAVQSQAGGGGGVPRIVVPRRIW